MQESIAKMFDTRKHSSCSGKSINFVKSAIVSSDYDADTGAFQPLIRHIHVKAHIITEQSTVMDNPRFKNNCQGRMSVLVYFSFIKNFCDGNRF